MGRRASEGSLELQQGLYIRQIAGVFHRYFKVGGVAVRKSLHTSDLAHASERALELFQDRAGRLAMGEPIHAVGFSKLADAYIRQVTGLGKAAYHIPTIRRHFLPYFASFRDVSKIRSRDINAYLEYRREKRPSVSPQTLNRENTVLRQLLRFPKTNEWAPNPPAVPSMSERHSRTRRRHFTSEEYDTLIRVAHERAQACQHLPTRRLFWNRSLLRDYILVLANTGLRVDESKTLIWRHVDFSSKSLILEHAGKTNSSRRVLIREPGLVALQNLRERRVQFLDRNRLGDLDPSKCVFCLPDGSFPQCHKTAFRKLLVDCQFADPNSSSRHVLTSLRHTYATFRLTARTGPRASIKALCKQMGTSECMIEQHYGDDAILDYAEELLG
jgi:integrase